MKKIRELIDTLNNWTKAYDEGHPIVSDEIWDDNYNKLLQLEQETGIVYPNSPTQSINYQVVNALTKVKHNHSMLSLGKTKSLEELKGFCGEHLMLGMLKLDGLTVSLHYQNGKLVKAETRGNGQIGEDITHNAMVISNIPKTIHATEDIIIDGEVLCSYKDFKAFENEYANPRNFASGSIRLLDANECAKRKLQFVAWDVITDVAQSLYLKLNWAINNGFDVVPFTLFRANEMSINDIIEGLKDINILNYQYPIDGIVFKYDDCKYYSSLGATSHHPNGGIAFKFYDEALESHLLDIEWSPGRTGVLTPIAVFETIDFGDSRVNKASLHNLSIMEQTIGIPYISQTVYVAKMNQIIPQIIDAEIPECPPITPIIPIPDTCPICGGATQIIESDSGTRELYCTNPDCQAKLINRIEHFLGKKGLDARGISKKTLEKLIDWGWIESLIDVFNLAQYRKEWIQVSGFGPASVDKILNSIEDAKNCELEKFICGLGIPLVGATYSREICKHFATWDEFVAAVEDPTYNFAEWNGFGIETNAALHNYNYTEAKEIYKKYLTNTIKNSIINQESKDSLSGEVIVITGGLTHFANRVELQNKIVELGGRSATSISGKTTMLICNDISSKSTKVIKAQQLGIPIRTEEEFIRDYLT